MKTSLRRSGQVARVKTSLGRPCYLFKKKERKKKKTISKIKVLHADVLWRRRSLSTPSQGPSSCYQRMSSTPPPRITMFFKVCAIFIMIWIFYRKIQFSTGTDSLPTGRRGSSTGKCKISTGSSMFYRKLPVEGCDGRNVFQMKI